MQNNLGTKSFASAVCGVPFLAAFQSWWLFCFHASSSGIPPQSRPYAVAVLGVLPSCLLICTLSFSFSQCPYSLLSLSLSLCVCALQHEATFREDKTYTLIQRLAHNVIKTGLRKINSSYSRISLQDLCEKVLGQRQQYWNLRAFCAPGNTQDWLGLVPCLLCCRGLVWFRRSC